PFVVRHNFSLAGVHQNLPAVSKVGQVMMLNPTSSRPPIGWPLLPVPDEHGCLQFPSLAESVQQNLRVILSTRAGEQLMRPDYGAGLTDFLGQPGRLTPHRSVLHLLRPS